MPVQVKNRRQGGRTPISTFQYAEIEFTGPDGTAHKWPLIELSVSGGSFQFPERIPGLEAGTTIEDGVICVNEFEIHVNFSIRRVTRDGGKSCTCGVQFHAMSHHDRNDMAALVLQLERHRQMT